MGTFPCKESKWPQDVPTVPCWCIPIGHLSCSTKLDTCLKCDTFIRWRFSIHFHIPSAWQGNQLTSGLMEEEGECFALLGLLAWGLSSLFNFQRLGTDKTWFFWSNGYSFCVNAIWSFKLEWEFIQKGNFLPTSKSLVQLVCMSTKKVKGCAYVRACLNKGGGIE